MSRKLKLDQFVYKCFKHAKIGLSKELLSFMVDKDGDWNRKKRIFEDQNSNEIDNLLANTI